MLPTGSMTGPPQLTKSLGQSTSSLLWRWLLPLAQPEAIKHWNPVAKPSCSDSILTKQSSVYDLISLRAREMLLSRCQHMCLCPYF